MYSLLKVPSPKSHNVLSLGSNPVLNSTSPFTQALIESISKSAKGVCFTKMLFVYESLTRVFLLVTVNVILNSPLALLGFGLANVCDGLSALEFPSPSKSQ
jgi:hypothetical protein